MNPPFSKPAPWVDKFIANNNGIALLVVSRGKWFAKIWDEAVAVMPMPPNVNFVRPDGSKKEISFQTFLFALGEPAKAALHRLNLARVR